MAALKSVTCHDEKEIKASIIVASSLGGTSYVGELVSFLHDIRQDTVIIARFEASRNEHLLAYYVDADSPMMSLMSLLSALDWHDEHECVTGFDGVGCSNE